MASFCKTFKIAVETCRIKLDRLYLNALTLVLLVYATLDVGSLTQPVCPVKPKFTRVKLFIGLAPACVRSEICARLI